MMTVKEYKAAVKSARRVFATVWIAQAGKTARNCRITKVQALQMIVGLNGNDTVQAKWLTDDKQFLMVG